MTVLAAAVLIAAATWCAFPAWRVERTGAIIQKPPVERTAVLTRVRASIGMGPAARRRSARDRARTVQALGALAAELESGQSPTAALLAAGGDPSVWPVTVAAVAVGEEIAPALVQDAQARPTLLSLAACWQVSTSTGTGFAEAVSRLAASARAGEAVRTDLEGELAGPRATARMLAILPVVGIGFGVMLGSDPLSWLLTTAPGIACGLAGVGLTALGILWTGRIAASVERML